MLWYNLASAEEVKNRLHDLLETYGFTTVHYFRDSEYGDPICNEYICPQAYEMAEALWGEYSEEVF